MSRYWHWIGAALGVIVGVIDAGLLAAAGVRMTVDGHDVATPVAALSELSFGIVGYLVGRLMQTRAALRADADTIRTQSGQIERRRAVALHHERLATLVEDPTALLLEV